MLKNIHLPVLLITTFLLFHPRAHAQTKEEIVKKYLETVGGTAKLAKLERIEIDQTLLTNNAEFAQRVIVVNNKAYYMQTKYPGKTMTIAVKDTIGWQINPFTGSNEAKALKKSDAATYMYQTDLAGPFFNYAEKGNTISLTGREKVNGEDCFNLFVKYKSGYGVSVFISSKSYLIKRLRDKFREVNYSDYQKYDGIMFPNATEIKSGMITMVFNVTKIKVNPKTDSSLFDFPTK